MSAKSSTAMTLEDLLAATGGALVYRPPEKRLIEGITTDSRKVPKGSVFIGVSGENFDGSDFAAAAAEQGASAVVVSWEKAPVVARTLRTVAVIAVESPVRALGLLGRGYRRRSQARVVAVTGSNGKTTTKEMIAAALSQTGSTLATDGNLNNEVGVPLTLFRLKAEHQFAVIEMGMNHEGEIGRLTAIAEPHVGLVTIASPVHLEGLGSLENVARAKGELYTGLSLDGVAVANADDPLMSERARWAGRRTTWFGAAARADVRLTRIVKHDRTGLTCVIHVFGDERTVQLPVVGVHNAMNACAAIAASLAAGATLDSILAGLSQARPPGRRLRLSPIPGMDATLLDDCYNANPPSTIAALDTLVALAPEGQRIAVLGDMRELGADEAAGHRQVGKKAARSGLKLLIAFGLASAQIVVGAAEAGFPRDRILHTDDPVAAASRVRSVLQTGDLVLVKASRGTRLERVSDLLVPPPAFGEALMFYLLLQPLHTKAPWLHWLWVFRYPSFRIILSFATALAIGLAIGPRTIAYLRFKQHGISNVREDTPESHQKKKGTPTLGGLMILFSLTVSTLLFADLQVKYVWSALFLTLGYGFTGWLDDYLKLSKRNSKGLPGRWKMVLLTFFFLAAMYGFFFDAHGPAPWLAIDKHLTFPFVTTRLFDVDIEWLYVPFAFIVVVGTSNAVNLTDGLDGLASGPTIVSAALFTVLAYIAGLSIPIHGEPNVAEYLHIPHVVGASELGVFSAAVAGAVVAFLWFNTYPAEIFMGDVGALALGGALGMMAVFTKNEIMSAIVHGVFLTEALSVMIQVISFKTTGKRIFKMAPIHHHFEKLGWPEPKIIVRFWIVSIMLAIVGVASLKLR